MLKSLAMSKKRVVLLSLVLLSSLALGFLMGFSIHSRLTDNENFGLLKEAYSLLETHYIDQLPEGFLLQRGMVSGMLEALEDPFTQYLEPQEHSAQSDTLAGEYGGIGALVTTDGLGNYFINPLSEGPSQSADIVEGTRLLAINGLPLNAEMSLELVVSLLRGPVDTEVRLRVRPPGEDSAKSLRLIRANIPLPSVTSYMLPSYAEIGVIGISVFSEKTLAEIQDALEKLTGQGAQGFVLDLRNNGGGLLESAVGTSRIFLREGMIVAEERRGAVEHTYSVVKPGRYAEYPLAVVVDGTTASAAEVVAAAMQENSRAVLIGARTYGKGSVQAVVELSDGSSMRITSSRWLKPDGKQLGTEGLEPDILLEDETARSEQAIIQAAEHLLDILGEGQ